MLSALLLVLAGSVSAGSVSDAQFEVLEGRVSLAAEDGVYEVRAGQAPRVVRGPGYLEIAPLSRVSIRWRRAGSLLIQGPASFEWSPEEERLIWRFHQVGKTHIEVRSRQVRLQLPGGWTAAFENGASFLRGRSNGGVEFHHDAGLPVLLAGPTASGQARPPWTVLAGAKLILSEGGGRPATLGGTQSRMLGPYARSEALARESSPAGARWSGFSWPWHATANLPVAAHAPAAPQSERLTAPSAPSAPAGAAAALPQAAERVPASPASSGPAKGPGAGAAAQPARTAAPGGPEQASQASEPPGGPGGAQGQEPRQQPGQQPAPPTGGSGGRSGPLPSPDPAEPSTETTESTPGASSEPGSAPAPGPSGPSGQPELPVPPGGGVNLGEYVPAARPHPWLEFVTHVRREGQLVMTPFGARWQEPTSDSSGSPRD